MKIFDNNKVSAGPFPAFYSLGCLQDPSHSQTNNPTVQDGIGTKDHPILVPPIPAMFLPNPTYSMLIAAAVAITENNLACDESPLARRVLVPVRTARRFYPSPH
mmetsp:Transcript_2872/g.17875  ORF Transcript_2872/g.17875 Transcript_2872/m.17875 type:complete len:104 (+) Transcript_2872:685-996(+)